VTMRLPDRDPADHRWADRPYGRDTATNGRFGIHGFACLSAAVAKLLRSGTRLVTFGPLNVDGM
jgi:hypothetical protein